MLPGLQSVEVGLHKHGFPWTPKSKPCRTVYECLPNCEDDALEPTTVPILEDNSPFYFHLITSRPEIHERWPWKNSIRPSYDSMGGPGYYKTSSEATEETKWLLSQPRVVVRE